MIIGLCVVCCRVLTGRNSGAAAKPDANRLMDALMRQLLLEHPGSKTVKGERHSRRNLIQQSYEKIHQLIVDNPNFKGTCIQLAKLNPETVSNW